MRSTFMGLETARRGMLAQQAALQTIGHNISNANTPGYTRQRVNFVQSEPYPAPSMNRPQIPGQIGTGVEAGTFQRIREGFLDVQFRGENNKQGYWESRSESLAKMEEIMNEPSESGLSKTMDRFWQSLQDLAVNPSNSGARSVVRQRGIAVTETFSYLSNSLTSIQNAIKSEISITEKEINSVVSQINKVNEQIGSVEPHGYMPNDLYDERDRLLDQLSGLVNIKVSPVSSKGNSLAVAEGKMTVELIDNSGKAIGTLVNGETNTFFEMTAKYNENGLVESLTLAGEPETIMDITDFPPNSGKLLGLIESYGYTYADAEGNMVSEGLYPKMLQDLDEMAYKFANEFNRIHSSGWNITSINAGSHSPINFFDITAKAGAASSIKVSQVIINSLDNIAAAGDNNGLVVSGTFNGTIEGVSNSYDKVKVEISYNEASKSFDYTINTEPKTVGSAIDKDELAATLQSTLGGIDTVTANFPNTLKQGDKWTFELEKGKSFSGALGDGRNALALADSKSNTLILGNNSTNFQNFYESVIGEMAVQAQEASRLATNSVVLRQSVEERRQSVSGVSLDEEMTNMIKFQQAYNASARNITIIDEMLDKIINGMGTGGR